MAKKNLFAQKIDPRVIDAIKTHKRAFTKSQIVEKVLQSPDVNSLMIQSYNIGRTWDLNLLVKQAVLGRVNTELRRKKKSPKLGVSLRIYENYGLGTGDAHRWQKFDVMNLAELQICINWRIDNIRANVSVVEAYEKVKDLMLLGEYQTIGEALAV